MKRIALLIALFATLALPGAAAAAQGHLTGGASLNTKLGITDITIHTAVGDGEQVNVATNNDKSNDCDGDAGSVDVQYTASPNATYNIVCAHYTGNKRMAFDYLDTTLNTYVVVFIVDRSPGQDTLLIGTTTDATLALQWVNRGYAGSGAKAAGRSFDSGDPAGDYLVES